MKITKDQFLAKLATLYRIGNASDSDGEDRQEWTKPQMAGEALCRPIDTAMREMVKAGVLTEEECQAWYDTL